MDVPDIDFLQVSGLSGIPPWLIQPDSRYVLVSG